MLFYSEAFCFLNAPQIFLRKSEPSLDFCQVGRVRGLFLATLFLPLRPLPALMTNMVHSQLILPRALVWHQ